MKKYITVKDLAGQFGVTTGRIRQIAITYNIGTMVGTVRVFTPAEVEKIRAHTRKKDRRES